MLYLDARFHPEDPEEHAAFMEWGNHPWNCGANALQVIHDLQNDLTGDDCDDGKCVDHACVCGFVIVLSPRFYRDSDTCR